MMEAKILVSTTSCTSTTKCHLVLKSTQVLQTMKRKRGGFIQQMQGQGNPFAASSRPPTVFEGHVQSKLALKLLEAWCWGTMSLPVLQQLASAAVEDGLQDPLLRFLLVGWGLGKKQRANHYFWGLSCIVIFCLNLGC